MICPYCGKENPENILYCNYCGGSLEIPAEKPYQDTPSIDTQVPEAQPPVQIPEPHTFVSQSPPKVRGGFLYGNKIWWLIGSCLVIFLVLSCAAVVWGISHISDWKTIFNPAKDTPISTVISNPISSTPAVIFGDDFSNPGSGWDQVDETDYFADYYENAYRIVVNSELSDSWANPDSNVFGDVTVEVDATKNAGPDDNDFGLICRYLSVTEFYYGVISSDGYFGITKVTSDASALLGRENLEFSAAINQGSATNHIRFDCIDNVLTLYVNGQQIDQQIDSAYSNGNIGLIAGTYDTPGTDILFDNFFVYKP